MSKTRASSSRVERNSATLKAVALRATTPHPSCFAWPLPPHGEKGKEGVLGLQPITRLEYPGDDRQAGRQEQKRHAEADPDADIGDAIETPAKAADEIDDRIDQRQGAPERRQHV